MIGNLKELNEKINVFVDYVVKTACESTTSGNYYVSVDDSLKASEMSYEDFLSYKSIIQNELAARDEVLDLDFNEAQEEFDVNCALDYCPGYQWCDGDEEIFGCSYEEWLERPVKPVYQAVNNVVGTITFHDSGEIVKYADKEEFVADYASALDSMGPMSCSAKVSSEDDFELRYQIHKIIMNEVGEDVEPFVQWKASIQGLEVDSMSQENELSPLDLKKYNYVEKMCEEDSEYQRLSETYEAALQSDNYDTQDRCYAEMGEIRDKYAAEFDTLPQSNEPDMYFTVRDMFGDDVGDKHIATFEEALKALKAFCSEHSDVAENSMLGMVCKDEDKTRRCILVQANINKYGKTVLRPMYDNISEDALAVPQIELASLKAKQIAYPFDEATQKRIDDLEKQLGIFEREVQTTGDLYVGKWRVHIVGSGERYGVNNNLVHDEARSLVEFWDMSANRGNFPNGQFVSRYYVETLFEDKWGPSPEQLMQGGLCLDGGNAGVWTVTGDEMTKVFEWLKDRPYKEGERFFEWHGDVDVPIWKMESHLVNSAYVAKAAGELFLSEVMAAQPFAKDVLIEPIGAYRDGWGYSVSFVCQANEETVNSSFKKAFEGMNYEFETESKVVADEKRSLESVINTCSEMSKESNARFEKAKDIDKDER